MADVQAPTTANPDVLPLPNDGPHAASAWKARYTGALNRMKPKVETGRANVRRYQVKHLDIAPAADTVVVPDDYANVEQKKAQLFFQSPEVALKATMPGLEKAVPVFQAVINEKLGPDEIDALSMVDEVLFDVLCPAGFGATKIGVDVVSAMVDVPIMSPEAATLAGLQPDQIPTQKAPSIIHQEYFWKRFSPGNLLYPDDFTGSNFDDAAWLGMRYPIDAAVGRREFKLAADTGKEVKLADDDMLMAPKPDGGGDRSATPKLICYEIWYKAALFDPKERHPKKIRQLVFVDGVDAPVIHRDSPYQAWDAFGRLVTGMEGFPIHVLTTRYVSDQALPPADCDITRVLNDEKSKFRTQMIQNRDRSMPQRAINTQIAGQEFKDAVTADSAKAFQAVIFVDGPVEEAIKPLALASYPRENYTANDYCDSDTAKAWGMGPNQLGADDEMDPTATGASIKQGNTDIRMSKERNRVLNWYAKGAAKLGAVIQLFADDTAYVQVTGAEGPPKLEAWDKTTIAGRYAFTVKADSGLKLDAMQEKRSALELYRVTANDPNIRRTELLKDIVNRYGFDADRLVAETLPEPPPDKPNISLSISGMDLNPVAPQYPAVLSILTKAGIAIPPGATQPVTSGAPQEHGGMAEEETGLGAGGPQRTGQLPGNGMAQAMGLQ